MQAVQKFKNNWKVPDLGSILFGGTQRGVHFWFGDMQRVTILIWGYAKSKRLRSPIKTIKRLNISGSFYQNEIEAIVVLFVVGVNVEVVRGFLQAKVPVLAPVWVQRDFRIELWRQVDDDALKTIQSKIKNLIWYHILLERNRVLGLS